VVLRHARRRVRNSIYVVTRPSTTEHPSLKPILAALRSRGSVTAATRQTHV
jgi:hypothetical protein